MSIAKCAHGVKRKVDIGMVDKIQLMKALVCLRILYLYHVKYGVSSTSRKLELVLQRRDGSGDKEKSTAAANALRIAFPLQPENRICPFANRKLFRKLSLLNPHNNSEIDSMFIPIGEMRKLRLTEINFPLSYSS